MSTKPAKRFHLGADFGGQARETKSASVVLRQKLLRAGAKALLLASLLLSIAVFSSAQDVTIKEYAVPTPPSSPNGITVGPDGALWFAESSSKGGFSEIGRITTAGAITEYPLPTGGGPELITAGPDGALWFTKAYTNQIGRITTTGVIEEYSLPRATHYAESYPTGIVAGPDGALWFAELFGNAIGRITTSGFILEYALPAPNSGPNGITVGPDGNLWFTESGGDRIGVITTAGVVTEYPLPRGRYPIRITAGPDGRLWFVNEVGNTIGAITTGGIVSEYPVRTPPPLFGLSLHGITVGPDGALWFTEAATNNIGRITTTGTVTEYPVPTANSSPLEITLGPDGALWFTEGGADKIGQIVLPKSVTATTLVTSLNPSVYGQRVTWTATVTTSGWVPPTGKVTFTWGRFSIGSAMLNSSGVATLTKSNLNADPYPLTAVYAGDAANLGSTSAVLNQVITQATTSATLTSSPNPSSSGQAVTFTATITSPTVMPTGPVTFAVGKTVLGTAQLGGGKAKLTISTLAVGSTRVTATYYGNSNIAKSSASVTQTVHQ